MYTYTTTDRTIMKPSSCADIAAPGYKNIECKRERSKKYQELARGNTQADLDDKDKSTCTLLPVIFGALGKRKQGCQKNLAAGENHCLLG